MGDMEDRLRDMEDRLHGIGSKVTESTTELRTKMEQMATKPDIAGVNGASEDRQKRENLWAMCSHK